MGKFDGVLLASDFDNTLIYTEAALRSGQPVPDLSPRNREALEYFMGWQNNVSSLFSWYLLFLYAVMLITHDRLFFHTAIPFRYYRT